MSEKDEFLGALRREARGILYDRWNQLGDLDIGIEATIEALKEMMVGEPTKARIGHDVEHIEGNLGSVVHGTWVQIYGLDDEGKLFIPSVLVGTPGPAIAIILPLKEE